MYFVNVRNFAFELNVICSLDRQTCLDLNAFVFIEIDIVLSACGARLKVVQNQLREGVHIDNARQFIVRKTNIIRRQI